MPEESTPLLQHISQELQDFRKEMNDKLKHFEDRFVTKDQFRPIERLVYGAASIILISFMSSVAYLVIQK